MAQDREFKFITGIETSTLPTATTPTNDDDLATKAYVDAQVSAPAVSWSVNGLVSQDFDTFDGWIRATQSRTFNTLVLTANEAGTGTTTVEIERWSGGPSGAATVSGNLTGGPGVATSKTTISLALVDGDMIRAKFTARASNLEDVRVEVI